jgi:hypothetical protein
MKNPGDELRRRSDAVKDLSFNTISTCNIELDATVFASAPNKPNYLPDMRLPRFSGQLTVWLQPR